MIRENYVIVIKNRSASYIGRVQKEKKDIVEECPDIEGPDPTAQMRSLIRELDWIFQNIWTYSKEL